MQPDRASDKAAAQATREWYRRARTACEQFIYASMRYRTPWVDDELLLTLEEARQWHAANPSPDPAMGVLLDSILNAYEEMTSATVGRVLELRQSVERYVEAMETWEPPVRPAPRASSDRPQVMPVTDECGKAGLGPAGCSPREAVWR
jgi:hypothetical protein